MVQYPREPDIDRVLTDIGIQQIIDDTVGAALAAQADADAAQAGVAALGTMSAQNANAVAITGGAAQLTAASGLTGGDQTNASYRVTYTPATSTSAGPRYQLECSAVPGGANHRIGQIRFQAATPTLGLKTGGAIFVKTLPAAWTDTDNGAWFDFQLVPPGSITAISVLSLTSTEMFLPAGAVVKINTVQVLAARQTGWTADTGTAKRTANATYSGTASAGYVQAELQAAMDALRDATRTIKALKDDMIAHGLIGA